MTDHPTWPGGVTRRHWHLAMRRWRTLPLLAAFALPLSLTPAVAAAASQTPHVTPATRPGPAQPHAPTAAPGAQPSAITIPGLPTGPQTVTLITGDQVTLNPVGPPGSTHHAMMVRPAPRVGGSSPPILISATTTPAGAAQASATPADAAAYFSGGSLDRGLFDVTYLASHESSGQLPVDVQFTTPMTDAQLATKAATLPASTLVQTLDASNAVEVSVDLEHAAQFWAAITGPATPGQLGGATLADGIAALWLDGHRLGRPGTLIPAGEPTYTLSVIIHVRTGAQTCCLIFSSLLGVQSSVAENVYSPSSITCADSNRVCQTVRVTYQVPAGVYSLSDLIMNVFADGEQWFEADDPQILVGNNTTISLALDDASKATTSAPNPAVPYAESVMENTRTLPDGTQFLSGVVGGPPLNAWALPTQPVTAGGYLFKTEWTLGQPQISMSIHAPNAVQLHPYPTPFFGEVNFGAAQTLPVVDAGFGNAADFANIDARGKLVLIRNEPGGARGCVVWLDKLQNALNAGAAGVLYDPTQPDDANGQSCQLPMPASWGYFGAPGFGQPVHVPPFAELTYGDAQTLRARLGQGPVDVTVSGPSGPTPYLYDVTYVDEGSIPASETHTVTTKNLAAADVNYHTVQQPSSLFEDYANWPSDQSFTIGISEEPVTLPRHINVFLGPISPDLVWWRTVEAFSPSSFQDLGDAQKLTIYNTAGPAGAEDWFDQPSPPGVQVFPPALLQAQPARFPTFAVCSGCRQGDDFIPWMYLTSPDPLMFTYSPDGFIWAGANPASVHLFQGSQEIPLTPNPFGLSEYTLPPQQASYRLTLDTSNTHTTWDFTSAEHTTDQAPAGYVCASQVLTGINAPCQPAPLIFLRYDAGVSLTNTVTAPGAHQISISAIHLGPTAPAITSLQVWTSTDGGQTWIPAPTAAPGGGKYTATYSVPPVSATNGTVSLKVQATDAGGNDNTQNNTDANSHTARPSPSTRPPRGGRLLGETGAVRQVTAPVSCDAVGRRYSCPAPCHVIVATNDGNITEIFYHPSIGSHISQPPLTRYGFVVPALEEIAPQPTTIGAQTAASLFRLWRAVDRRTNLGSDGRRREAGCPERARRYLALAWRERLAATAELTRGRVG